MCCWANGCNDLFHSDVLSHRLVVQALQLAQETEKYQKDVDRIRQTNAELNIRIKEVDAENKKLEQGLKEVLKSVKDANAGGKAGQYSVR